MSCDAARISGPDFGLVEEHTFADLKVRLDMEHNWKLQVSQPFRANHKAQLYQLMLNGGTDL